MGKSCCIKGCDISSPDVEYFKFPRSGSLHAAWVAATGAPGGDVCSAHFTEHDYRDMRGKRRLLGTAVPSVFNHKPSSNTENGDISSVDSTDKTNQNINNKNKTSRRKTRGRKTIDNSHEATDSLLNKTDDNSADKTDGNSTDKTETIDNNDTTDNDDTMDGKIENGESSQDTRQTGTSENGKDEKKTENAIPEVKDIEDMITNYQIKQTKTLADRLNPEPLEDLIPAIMESQPIPVPVQQTQQTSELSHVSNKLCVSQLANHLSDKLDDHLAQIISSAPVFIEVSVDQGVQGATRSESPQDCLMLLESVQCDIDPSSLMLPEPDSDSDMEITDVGTKTEDPNPISLLTSSDEDEVIIQEPHIDTVEVSDETDEDDKPLQRLIKDKPKKVKKPKEKKSYDLSVPYYCAQCDFRTESQAEFKQHNRELGHLRGTTIQVCPTCNYSTASKAQFSRHRRKHKDERNFKCHLCNYKARHSMSLIYHLKCHDVSNEKKQDKFTCKMCGFSSNVKVEALKHLKSCDGSKFSCDQCSYSTKRRSDLRRHKMRRHSVDDSDEDFTL